MRITRFIRDCSGAAAAEMVLVTPFLVVILFGTVELGNLMLDEHSLEKQVRDGARYASRLTISNAYSCPGTVFADPDAEANIIKVTKDGVVSGTGSPRWTDYWDRKCASGDDTLTVSVRCVAKSDVDTGGTGNTGLYSSLPGTDIPVVTVAGEVQYRSVMSTLGWDSDICLHAESEAAVQGV